MPGRVEVRPVGDVPEEVTAAVARRVAEALGLEAWIAPALPPPAGALDRRRRQYAAPLVLRELRSAGEAGAMRVLGVTEVDLFIPMLTFVFGQAQLDGRAAVVSLARLRQEFYGLPSDAGLLLRRAEKEVLHELGHTFRALHCADPSCAMSLSSSISQVDAKRGAYCDGCRALIADGLAAAAGSRRAETEDRR